MTCSSSNYWLATDEVCVLRNKHRTQNVCILLNPGFFSPVIISVSAFCPGQILTQPHPERLLYLHSGIQRWFKLLASGIFAASGHLAHTHTHTHRRAAEQLCPHWLGLIGWAVRQGLMGNALAWKIRGWTGLEVRNPPNPQNTHSHCKTPLALCVFAASFVCL